MNKDKNRFTSVTKQFLYAQITYSIYSKIKRWT